MHYCYVSNTTGIFLICQMVTKIKANCRMFHLFIGCKLSLITFVSDVMS